MASLQLRGKTWRCLFMYKKKLHAFTIGKVDEIEARAISAKVDYLLMRLKQKLLDLPDGCDIVSFVQHDGKLPPKDGIPKPPEKAVTISSLLSMYLRTHENGTLEERTLADTKSHFKHWYATLGKDFEIQNLTMPDVQQHVNRRTGHPDLVSSKTAKKEVVSLRTVWNWGVRFHLLEGAFPNRGLRYPKVERKPPFMTWTEIERQIQAGGDPKALWDCLFLTTAEISELLAFVKAKATQPWTYPLFCFAAYTGARRSEMLLAEVADVDFDGHAVQIREKKRVRLEFCTFFGFHK
ncbi:MAG: tyrosine-type recombinase/integrase [Gemmataceae bacterium]